MASGYFSTDDPSRFHPVVEALSRHDPFLLLADYASYIACQERVDGVFRQPDEWAKRAILNVAGMGRFSSDRTVLEYASLVWDVEPAPTRAGAPRWDPDAMR